MRATRVSYTASRHSYGRVLPPGSRCSSLCPYDRDTLRPRDIEAAIDNHPFLHVDGRTSENGRFGTPVEWFGGDLPEPAVETESVEFDLERLFLVRKLVDERAGAFGLEPEPRR